MAAIAALVFIILSKSKGEVDLTGTVEEQKLTADTAGLSETEQALAAPSNPVEESTQTESGAVANTRRMIQAHAPLRVEAIDNPDSPENQRILQQMVLKSIGARASIEANEN